MVHPKRLPHDLDFNLETIVGNISAASGRQFRGKAAKRRGDAGGGSRVGNTHFSRQETAETFRGRRRSQFNTCFNGPDRLFTGHSRSDGAIFRAEGDLSRQQSRQMIRRGGDPKVGDDKLGTGEI